MPLPECVRPDDEQQLCEIIAAAAAEGRRLSLRGGSSHAGFGAPHQPATEVDMTAFAGVADYDAAELVITAGAGTALAEVQSLLEKEQQMLAFEPYDPAPLFGREPGRTTLGGMIASGTAGSRRLTRGTVRDHLLGFTAVSGRGERFVAGGRVVKNVTGYDLPKLLCGSWGRLAALTQVTLKVLPAPRCAQTLLVPGLTPRQAQEVFGELLGTYTALAAAAFIPGGIEHQQSLTALRLEGFPPSVDASRQQVRAVLDRLRSAGSEELADDAAFWQRIQTAAAFAGEQSLWKIFAPTAASVTVADELEQLGAQWLWDWAGGLTWAASSAPAAQIRAIAARAGGHARLIRAIDSVRQVTAALHPQPVAIQRLEEKVRRAFDPTGVFETGRILSGDHEN